VRSARGPLNIAPHREPHTMFDDSSFALRTALATSLGACFGLFLIVVSSLS
jgi:hypothetical protein